MNAIETPFFFPTFFLPMTIGIEPPQAQLLTKQQVIDKTRQESLDALKDPFVFPKPIKKVAVIGAGPAGVSLLLLNEPISSILM